MRVCFYFGVVNRAVGRGGRNVNEDRDAMINTAKVVHVSFCSKKRNN